MGRRFAGFMVPADQAGPYDYREQNYDGNDDGGGKHGVSSVDVVSPYIS